jgi:peptidoglycan/LPS O-acetylase OafA/YrhL
MAVVDVDARSTRTQEVARSSRVPQPAISALAAGQLVGLDGLRAFSVLAVMIGHYGFGSILPGGLGVTVFFFISGFLITTLMLRETRATGTISIGQFYLRRLLRLQPELWALLIISGVVGVNYSAPVRLLDVFGGFFYFSNYIYVGVLGGDGMGHLRWPQLWSLAIEEHYYLTYPLMFFVMIRRPVAFIWLLAGILLGGLALRLLLLHWGVDGEYLYAATETRFDSIAYGCLTALCLWYLPDAAKAAIDRNGVLIGGAAVALLLVSLAIRTPEFRDAIRYSVQGVAITLGITFLFATKHGPAVGRALNIAPLKWMGLMSYGAYLWHMEVGAFIQAWTGLHWYTSPSLAAGISAIVFSAATFGVAWVSYTVLQRPLLALRHRLGAQA